MILILLSLLPAGALSSPANPKNGGKWVVVIDPGHGGRDPGALGSTSKEKNVNLAVALKTAKYLSDNLSNVNVILTRDKDSTLDLLERPKIANRNNADLFISIHSNFAWSKTVTGAETYIMGLAENEENLEVAMKENEVILLEDDYSAKYEGFDPKSPESYIIFTLTQNVFQKQSIDLASRIQTQLVERVGRKDRGVKQAGFWVLYRTSMPSVLVETGFITNLTEEKYLNSQEGQDYLASAIYRACRDYFADLDLRSGIKVDTAARASSAVRSQSVSGNIIFRVQVSSGGTTKEVRPENFKGLTDIEEIKMGERYRYVTGAFDDYAAAVNHRKKIEAVYPDAFVIAIKDNKVLPLQQALEQKRRNKTKN